MKKSQVILSPTQPKDISIVKSELIDQDECLNVSTILNDSLPQWASSTNNEEGIDTTLSHQNVPPPQQQERNSIADDSNMFANEVEEQQEEKEEEIDADVMVNESNQLVQENETLKKEQVKEEEEEEEKVEAQQYQQQQQKEIDLIQNASEIVEEPQEEEENENDLDNSDDFDANEFVKKTVLEAKKWKNILNKHKQRMKDNLASFQDYETQKLVLKNEKITSQDQIIDKEEQEDIIMNESITNEPAMTFDLEEQQENLAGEEEEEEDLAEEEEEDLEEQQEEDLEEQQEEEQEEIADKENNSHIPSFMKMTSSALNRKKAQEQVKNDKKIVTNKVKIDKYKLTTPISPNFTKRVPRNKNRKRSNKLTTTTHLLPVRSTVKLTQPKEFSFASDIRMERRRSISLSRERGEDTGLSKDQSLLHQRKKSNIPTTKTEPFTFATAHRSSSRSRSRSRNRSNSMDKTTNKEEEQKQEEHVLNNSNQNIKQRGRRRRKPRINRSETTSFQPFTFATANRSRSRSRSLTKEKVNPKEVVTNGPSFSFNTSTTIQSNDPFINSLRSHSRSRSRSRSRSVTTIPQEFNFTIDQRIEQRKELRKQQQQISIKKVNRITVQPRFTSAKSTKPLTQAMSPTFGSNKKRKNSTIQKLLALETSDISQTIKSTFNKQSGTIFASKKFSSIAVTGASLHDDDDDHFTTTVTECLPFEFETEKRGQIIQAKLADKIEAELEAKEALEMEQNEKFKKNIQISSIPHTLPYVAKKPNTVIQPFSFDENHQINHQKTSYKKPKFFTIKKSYKPLTEIKSPNLLTKKRASKRKEIDIKQPQQPPQPSDDQSQTKFQQFMSSKSIKTRFFGKKKKKNQNLLDILIYFYDRMDRWITTPH